MSNAIETIVRENGVTIEIFYDDSGCGNPREDFQGTTMALFHKNYDLPNEAELSSNDFDGWDEMEAHIRANFDVVGLLPVRGYDHSGLRLSTYTGGQFADKWDSGQAGFIFVTREKLDEMGTPDDLIEELLTQDVALYDAWANGEVYGYVVTAPDGEEIDSCWGFVDADDGDYCKAEAIRAADGYVPPTDVEVAVKQAESWIHRLGNIKDQIEETGNAVNFQRRSQLARVTGLIEQANQALLDYINDTKESA